MPDPTAVLGDHLYFTRTIAANLAKKAVPRELRNTLSENNSLGKVVFERGSLEQLESTDRIGRGQYMWNLQREKETNCVINASGEEVVAYNESAVHLKFVDAEIKLLHWLSNPNQLVQAGPAALHQVMADMGLESMTDTGVKEWEEAAESAFRDMYDKLAVGCVRSSGPRKDANRAKKEFAACLSQRREYWSEVRLKIFTDQAPGDIEADGSARFDIGESSRFIALKLLAYVAVSNLDAGYDSDVQSIVSRPGTPMTSGHTTLGTTSGQVSIARTTLKRVRFSDDLESSLPLASGSLTASSSPATRISILKNGQVDVAPEGC
jgi:hypothetical protein